MSRPETGQEDKKGMVADLRAPEGKLFIGGKWVDPLDGKVGPAENPADESVLASVAMGGAEDIDAAVTSAVAAAPQWGRWSWTARSAALRSMAARLRADSDRLARVDTLDSGNPIAGSIADVEASAEALEFFAGLGGEAGGTTIPGAPGTLTFTERVPFGVVGRITAYNHPLMFIAQGVAAALVTGNAVVVKPADPTVLSSLEFARIAEDDLPPGVLNVVPGGASVGQALVTHPDVPRIAFTGSVATGRHILLGAAHHIKRVSLELGGKNPLLVFPDADPETAADAAFRGMNFTRTNGQSCMSTSRVLVHESLRSEVVAILAERMAALRIGAPVDPQVDVGPMAFAAHYERVLEHIATAKAQGARLVVGGGRPDDLPVGHFVAPTLFDDVDESMSIANDEVFGPVVAVMGWTDEDDALRVANSTDYGLTANVVTSDLGRAMRASRALRAGIVWVNGPNPLPPGTPFGGMKASGLGREHGTEELLSYTEEKSIVLRY